MVDTSVGFSQIADPELDGPDSSLESLDPQALETVCLHLARPTFCLWSLSGTMHRPLHSVLPDPSGIYHSEGVLKKFQTPDGKCLDGKHRIQSPFGDDRKLAARPHPFNRAK